MALDKNKKLFFISLIPLIGLYTFGLVFFNMYEPVETEVKNHESQIIQSNEKLFKVYAVCDGDTIVIRPQSKITQHKFSENKLCSHNNNLPKEFEKVRLLGIDAFEMGQNELGNKSKQYLSELIANKYIRIELDAEKRDKYDRLLGYVYLIPEQEDIIPGYTNNNLPKDDVFINEDLIKNGLALVYNYKNDIKHIDALKDAQDYARKNMLGAWEDDDYIKETPYQYRKNKL